MAFLIKYHKLFEVRLIHAFYLRDEAAFYAMTEEGKAKELLETNYNILNDLDIIPTKACQKILDGHRLRFKASSLGFVVGVDTIDEGDGVKPSIPIAEGTVFHFKIRIKNTQWTNYTNARLKPSIKANLYFSNVENQAELQDTGDALRPALALQPLEHNPNRAYEMGEIVKNGTTYIMAKENTSGRSAPPSRNWERISDLKNVNTANNRLLSSRFTYSFLLNTGVTITELTVDLLRSDDTLEKSISLPIPDRMTNVELDFRVKVGEKMVNVPPGQYTLKVNSPEGYQESLLVHIDDELYDASDWGVVAIAHHANLPKTAYRILENNGNLRTEAGEPKNPVFEIRIKNRATYWRYILHPADSALSPPGNDFINDDNTLLTKNTFPLSRFYKNHALQLDSKDLPNPSDLLVKQDKNKIKYLSEIYLPKLNF